MWLLYAMISHNFLSIENLSNFFDSSKIVFKTAGVLLEEMQDKGLNALNYKVIILDEVHERSAESDLVLVCVKQFLMKNKDLRWHIYAVHFVLSTYLVLFVYVVFSFFTVELWGKLIKSTSDLRDLQNFQGSVDVSDC